MEEGLDSWMAVGEGPGWKAPGCIDPLPSRMEVDGLLRAGGFVVLDMM
jgi:hypothetical protein